MLARYILALQYSEFYDRTRRLARLCFSKNFRARNRYFNNQIRVIDETYLRLYETGERNPAYDLPGADPGTVSRYTPAAEARHGLELALGHTGLTLEYLNFCIARGYTEGRREAGILLEKEMKTLSQRIAAAKALNIPLEPYAAQHPWAELNLAL
jgi:hypothetical protein